MKKYILSAATAVALLSACSKDDDKTEYAGKATLTFDSRVGTEDFALNKDFTINSRTYQFTAFRYWISNVVLVRVDGSEYEVPASYYLIEELNKIAVQDGAFEYPAKKREDVTLSDIPLGEYKAVRFSIGVDQQHNDNLALQAGELSQLNGMTNVSWMWHTT
ncbi:MbnP family protein [Chitinophaga cymbidii]|uniref:Copper-binding protein MbnP-like domain-containing protein n=1 Tax=Chitinophaga cymbidii TaxID=1096750 RepID=A0A512RS28_9BACT|nr:MbnP family protein [Chitinophaga cymbidii]GEP98503.1 hypothetical protein CCY01nite_47630 [Chitinophaga cymbidii]